MKKILIIFCLIIFVNGFSQDIHYSQYDVMLQRFNPAVISSVNNVWRFAGDYRNQWFDFNNNYTTYQAEAILKLQDKKFKKLSFGLYGYHDVVTKTGFSNSAFYFTTAYPITIKKHEIALGLQGGFIYRTVDLTDRTFPGQWDYSQGIFDSNLSSNEQLDDRSQLIGDFSTGISWNWINKFGQLNTGLSLFHLTQPKDGFVSSGRLDRLYNVHIAQKIFTKKNKRWALEPKARYLFSAQASQLVVGMETNYFVPSKNVENEDDMLIFGLYARAGFARNYDAIIPFVGYKHKRTQAIFSYDLNIGELSRDVGVKSTIELSLVYVIPTKKVNFYSIPCGIY